MNSTRLRYTTIGTLSIIWLNIVIPLLKDTLTYRSTIFPKTPINQIEVLKLIASSLLLTFSLFRQGIIKLKTTDLCKPQNSKKMIPIILLMLISTPFVFGYVYDNSFQSFGQMILDLGGTVMDEDFDDTPPGEDPLGWEEESGSWYAVDDGGNLVYYNDDDGDSEALTISTSGDTSWTDYSFLVDVKFVEGPSNKADRAALLVYRYTSGNDYYFLAMREAQDELEVYKHGVGGGGHLRGSVSCTLVQDTWYSVNVTIRNDSVWISIDDTYYFSGLEMLGSHSNGSVGIGTRYYKVMFDNIMVEIRE